MDTSKGKETENFDSRYRFLKTPEGLITPEAEVMARGLDLMLQDLNNLKTYTEYRQKAPFGKIENLAEQLAAITSEQRKIIEVTANLDKIDVAEDLDEVEENVKKRAEYFQDLFKDLEDPADFEPIVIELQDLGRLPFIYAKANGQIKHDIDQITSSNLGQVQFYERRLERGTATEDSALEMTGVLDDRNIRLNEFLTSNAANILNERYPRSNVSGSEIHERFETATEQEQQIFIQKAADEHTEELIKQTQIEIVYLDPKEGAETVVYDIDFIKQMATNILNNSFKSIIEANRPQNTITIEVKITDDTIEASVMDTGTGFSQELLAKDFEKNFSGFRDGKRVTGTGTGMAGQQEMITHYGGKFKKENITDNKGEILGGKITAIFPKGELGKTPPEGGA